jgi:hypothetical protein
VSEHSVTEEEGRMATDEMKDLPAALADVRRAVETLATEVAKARASSDATLQWTKVMAVASLAIAAVTYLLFLIYLFG